MPTVQEVGPDPGDDDGQRQRELDLEEPLARGHPDAAGRLDHREVDPVQARDRVPQDRQEAVEHEDTPSTASARP
jgi:hypothetical protein